MKHHVLVTVDTERTGEGLAELVCDSITIMIDDPFEVALLDVPAGTTVPELLVFIRALEQAVAGGKIVAITADRDDPTVDAPLIVGFGRDFLEPPKLDRSLLMKQVPEPLAKPGRLPDDPPEGYDEMNGNGCEECARSRGPWYRGACDHG